MNDGPTTPVSLQPRRAVITGASGGIGEAIADTLLAKGFSDITLVARPSPRLDAARARLLSRHPTARVHAAGGDLSLQREVRALAASWSSSPPDVLLLNAALMPGERRLTAEGIEETLATNHLSPYLLARLVVPTLRPGARVVVVGADPGMLALEPVQLDDLQFERQFSPVKAYMRTKNMNAMFTYALARRAPNGVTVNAAHPGVIRTELGRNARGLMGLALTLARPFLPSPATGADTPAWLAWSDEVETKTGCFFVKRQVRQTAPHTLAVERQEELWRESARLVNLPP